MIINNGITAPFGFKANGIWCGIKKNKRALDLALIYSSVSCNSAGVFTSNRIKAAPVLVTQNRIKDAKAQAIIINSGNANCLTGKAGISDAKAMAESVGKLLSLKRNEVLVASTGIIGKRLPVDKIKRAAPLLVKGLSKNAGQKVATAIMTTDTFAKEAGATFKIKSSKVVIGGIAKGAGMICPALATMLCFITTDAAIEKKALKKALKDAVNDSFNSITVDGDMSTNDMVIILANGLACNPVIKTGDKNYKLFHDALSSVCQDLAKKIIQDAEGATKFVEINVKNASSLAQAKLIAKKIANSTLLKTALAGSDPNWGRIAASAGASGADFRQEKLDIYLGDIRVLKNGRSTGVNYGRLKNIFDKKEIKIDLDLHNGKADATVWTCDLTENYVKINAGYSS